MAGGESESCHDSRCIVIQAGHTACVRIYEETQRYLSHSHRGIPRWPRRIPKSPETTVSSLEKHLNYQSG